MFILRLGIGVLYVILQVIAFATWLILLVVSILVSCVVVAGVTTVAGVSEAVKNFRKIDAWSYRKFQTIDLQDEKRIARTVKYDRQGNKMKTTYGAAYWLNKLFYGAAMLLNGVLSIFMVIGYTLWGIFCGVPVGYIKVAPFLEFIAGITKKESAHTRDTI